jgi:RNA polymerase sigma factor (sigma-70 family)
MPAGGTPMANERPSDPYVTRPSIFVRINAPEDKPKQLAWQTFHERYAPIIAGFARNLGARFQDVDDIIQEVMLGFFKVSPTYQYDPQKGRFRGYLKVCTLNAIRACASKSAHLATIPLERLNPESPAIDENWDAEWERHLLDLAMAEARRDYRDNKTFRAFELYAIQGQKPEEVAEQLQMTTASVYMAKKRVTDALRLKVQSMKDEFGW